LKGMRFSAPNRDKMNYPAAKDGWVSDNGLPSPFEQPDFRANRLPTTF